MTLLEDKVIRILWSLVDDSLTRDISDSEIKEFKFDTHFYFNTIISLDNSKETKCIWYSLLKTAGSINQQYFFGPL